MLEETHQLAIGKVIIINEHTHELIPREGEITKEDVDDYISFLKQHLKLPVKILLNKINSYSYSFLAQRCFHESSYEPTIAILNASKAGRLAFESMALLTNNWTYAFFESREEALDWVNDQKR